MKSSTLFLLISFFVLFISCSPTGSDDNDDGPPRTIVFASQNDGQFQIFSMREDGSGVRQLTDNEFGATNPAWSPNGSRIAYARSFGSTGGPELWVMDADGSNPQPLVLNPRTGNTQFGNHPAWSPDGSKLAFDLCLNCEFGGGNAEIFVADLQAGTVDTLTSHPTADTHPTWSPDGNIIAFTSNRDYFDADTLAFREEIYVVDSNGNNLRRLTKIGISRDPVWNPTNNTIGFGSNVSSLLGLYQVEVESEKINTIDENFASTFLLVPMAWSPEGQKLLIIARNNSNPEENFSFSILNTKDGQAESIPFESELIIGADWFINPNN